MSQSKGIPSWLFRNSDHLAGGRTAGDFRLPTPRRTIDTYRKVLAQALTENPESRSIELLHQARQVG